VSGPRAFTALVNPIAGGGRAAQRWAPVETLLRRAGADIRTESTRSREHGVELAAAAAADGRVVVAVGGDGLVRDVAGGIVRALGGEAGTSTADPGPALAIVPAGRGNDLVRKLRLPSAPDAVAHLLLTGRPRALDVIEAASGAVPGGAVIVPGNVYAGIDAVANERINNSRMLPGLLAYRLAPVLAVATWRPPTYALTVDGRARAVKAHTVVIANSGAYGHGLDIVPPAVPDDGLLHVMSVGAGPRRAIAAFMREAKTGRHVERPEIEIVTAQQVTIAADRAVPVYADGDPIGELPVTVRVRPRALPLLCG
jgi:diacylglycerol kinase family enzyme